jgi:hypothetical protein
MAARPAIQTESPYLVAYLVLLCSAYGLVGYAIFMVLGKHG